MVDVEKNEQNCFIQNIKNDAEWIYGTNLILYIDMFLLQIISYEKVEINFFKKCCHNKGDDNMS